MKHNVVKRLLAFTLAMAMLAGVVSCGSPDNNWDQTDGQGNEEEQESVWETEVVSAEDPENKYEGYSLVWNDEFDGEELDKTKWSCQIGTGTSEGLTDWGNQELEYYTDDEKNVRVEDGNLVITAIKEEERVGGKMFTSARLRTMTDEGDVLFSTKYGRVEARIKLPQGEGLWPAFWMLPVDDSIYNEWASSGEIDIMEARGRLPDRIEGTIHYGQNWPNNVYKGQEFVMTADTDITDYHLYSLEWEPGILRWYIDNVCYHTSEQWFSKGPNGGTDYTWPAPFDVPFYILLNMAVGGTFDLESNPYATEYPAEMKVDYVRVYQKDGGYATGSDAGIVEADNKDKEGFEKYAASYEDGEFIADPDFTTMNIEPIEDTNNGIIPESKDWQFAVGDFGGFAKAEVEELEEGSFAKIDISSGGSQTYAVQLIQHIPVVQGYSYMVSFDAKSSNERSFFVSPSGDGDNGWEKYGVYEASVGTELANYNFVFEMNSTTDPTARLEFNLGNNIGTLWIGNVSVTELKSEDGIDHDMKKTPLPNGNRIYNGTFDQGVQRIAFWHVENMDVAIPDVVLNADGSEDYRRMAQVKADHAEAVMYQNGIQLNGGSYNLSMDMKGEAPAEVQVVLTGLDGTVYLDDVCSYDGNGEKSSSSVLFDVPEGIKDDSVVLSIKFEEETEIWIDNVSLNMVEE